LATVTSHALKYDVITYSPHEGLNYTISDKTTPLWKRIVSVNYLKFKKAVTEASQVISVTRATHTIYS